MVKATEFALDILHSCSDLTSHWVKDIELESVIAVFALIITHAQLVTQCIYATAVFSNKGPAFTWSVDTFMNKHRRRTSNIREHAFVSEA